MSARTFVMLCAAGFAFAYGVLLALVMRRPPVMLDAVLVLGALVVAAWLHNSAPILEAFKAWLGRGKGGSGSEGAG